MKSIKELIEDARNCHENQIAHYLEQAQEYHEEQMKINRGWQTEMRAKEKEIEELKSALKSQCDLASMHINRGNEFQNKYEELKKQIQDGSNRKTEQLEEKRAKLVQTATKDYIDEDSVQVSSSTKIQHPDYISKADVKKTIENWIKGFTKLGSGRGEYLIVYPKDLLELKKELGISEEVKA